MDCVACSVSVFRLLFVIGATFVTPALNTVFPNPLYSILNKGHNPLMVANLSVLQWLAPFTLSAMMQEECAYCRRHASLLLEIFVGFLKFRVEWRSSVIVYYKQLIHACMRTVISPTTCRFFGRLNHIATSIIVNYLDVVLLLCF
jgi:hypothetical protein